MSETNYQTSEQFYAGVDNYVCKAGHEFEGKVPQGVSREGFAVRLDVK